MPFERVAARERQGALRGEPGSSLSGEYAPDSTSQGRAEPLCARMKGVNREVSEGKTDV